MALMRNARYTMACAGLLLFSHGIAFPALAQSVLEPPLTVAVSDFEGVDLSPAETWLTDALTESVIASLIRSGAVTVVERRFLSQVMDELALQLSGAVDPDTAVEVGNLLGALLIIVGTVESRGDSVWVRARVLEVATAGVRGTYDSSGPKEMLAAVEMKLADQLIGALQREEGRRRVEERAPPPLPSILRSGLERAHLLTDAAPLFGADPGRRRRRSDYLMAVDLAERVLASNPSAPRAHVVRGIAWLNLDDAGVAAASFEEALRASPKNLEALLGLANAHFTLHLYPQALESALAAVKLAPQDARARYVLGRILFEQNKNVEAAAVFIESIERSPRVPDAETTLRVLLGGTEGRQIVQSLASMGGGFAEAARLVQARWSGKGLPARPGVELALKLRPGFYLAPYWAGLYARRDKNWDEAERYLRQALSLNPSFPLVHRELGRLALEHNRYEEGEHHIKLYIRTSDLVEDFDELQRLLDRYKPPPDNEKIHRPREVSGCANR